MKIASSNVQLESSHVALSKFESRERLEVWTGERGRAQGNRGNGIGAMVSDLARAPVEISKEARALHEAEGVDGDAEAVDADPRMRFLKQIIEALTGRPIHTIAAKDLRADIPQIDGMPNDAPSARDNAPRRAGYGVEYDYHASYQELERTNFAAEGTVKTADGQEIRFKLELNMERSYSETTDVQVRLGDARMKDPLVLDFAGPGAALSDARFSFDLDADGNAEDLPMLAGGTGYLAIDRNENGQIDDGSELFGPTTGDGFSELAALDSDDNGWIDESDSAFAQLRVWSPATGGPGTLQTASDAGVGALYLGNVATPFALRGAANNTLGAMRSSSIYLREDGSTGTVSQIDLAV